MQISMDDETLRTRERLARLQGLYFLGTGLWPIFHMKSFLKVTGPKADLWLVRTVGVVVASIGWGLLSSKRRELGSGMTTIATASAAGLGAIDVIYSLRGRIAKIYLLDAVAEAALVTMWLRSSAPGLKSHRLRSLKRVLPRAA